MSNFAIWWEREGSAMKPLPNEDTEEFAKRVTQIAWSNGEYVEREACAKVCDVLADDYGKAGLPMTYQALTATAKEIRARGQA